MSRHIKTNQSHFAITPNISIQRSVFDRSFVYKTTFDSGKLIPFFCDEVLPGDSFKLNVTTFCRLATPFVPFMDNLYLRTHFFFVPNRLVWNNWQKFCGEQENPGDSTDYVIPTHVETSGGVLECRLQDYFGIPTRKNISYNVLPLRAYFLIWNEWFRDENLQDSFPVCKDDTGNVLKDSSGNVDPVVNGLHWYECAPRGKRYDYFTGCLPWPQKGPGVELPLGATAEVTGGANAVSVSVGKVDIFNNGSARVGTFYGTGFGNYNSTLNSTSNAGSAVITGSVDASKLSVDLSGATAITINSLRQAFQLQRFYEKDARGGTRYIEKIKAHFGVTSPDARLQRPEYLGGHESMININPVAQTSASDSTTPQGNLAAYGVAGDSYHGFTKSFVEHGYIIGLISVRADLTYQQGLNRMWSRKTMLDFYWPSFAHLGEQAVLNKEIYAQGTSADDDVFGYQERYGEYRYKPSLITGQFRSNSMDSAGNSNSLDVWHLAQNFATLPKLSNEFIQDHPPVSRVLALQGTDKVKYPEFLLDCKFNLKCTRPMPMFGVPGLIDHF